MKNKNWTFLEVSYFRLKLEFVHDCIWKQFFASSLPPSPGSFKRNLFDDFGNSKIFNTVLT